MDVITTPAAISSQPLPPIISPAPERSLHRLSEVRRREQISRRTIARRLGISVSQVKEREQPAADMRLSDLYRWQEVLGATLGELLNEPQGELAPPVQLRARLLRAMKTVQSMQLRAQQLPVRRLATMLVDQLVELMPELKGVAARPAGNRRRSNGVEPLGWHLVYERR